MSHSLVNSMKWSRDSQARIEFWSFALVTYCAFEEIHVKLIYFLLAIQITTLAAYSARVLSDRLTRLCVDRE